MKVRISHQGPHDLIVSSNGGPTFRIAKMSWWDWLWRRSETYDISQNEIVVIRTDAATEPDGVALKNHV